MTCAPASAGIESASAVPKSIRVTTHLLSAEHDRFRYCTDIVLHLPEAQAGPTLAGAAGNRELLRGRVVLADRRALDRSAGHAVHDGHLVVVPGKDHDTRAAAAERRQTQDPVEREPVVAEPARAPVPQLHLSVDLDGRADVQLQLVRNGPLVRCGVGWKAIEHV